MKTKYAVNNNLRTQYRHHVALIIVYFNRYGWVTLHNKNVEESTNWPLVEWFVSFFSNAQSMGRKILDD